MQTCSDLYFVPVNLGAIAVLLGEIKSVTSHNAPDSPLKSRLDAGGQITFLVLTVSQVHGIIKAAIEDFRFA